MSYAKYVFVDMDGVLVDFVGGVFNFFEADPTNYNPRGDYELTNYLNLPPKEFWSRLDKCEDFWETLHITPEAEPLLDFLLSRVDEKNIFLLTSPALHPNCFYGKAAWVKKHFPQFLPRLILTEHKQFLAARDRLLIDDSDRNISRFREHQGLAVLVPRKWNSQHAFHEDALHMTIQSLKRFL